MPIPRPSKRAGSNGPAPPITVRSRRCCGQAGEFDLVYLHRITNAAKYAELARHHFPKARQIHSVADLHPLRAARPPAAEDRPELSPIAHRLRLMEFAAAAFADAV